jgi:hypothetical protein
VIGQIPDDLQPAVQPVIQMIEELSQRIRAHERTLGTMAAQRYPV